MTCRALLLLSLLLGGCGDDGGTTPDGGGGSDGGGSDGGGECREVDTECPAGIPSQGGACEGMLSCNFTEESGNEWRYDCVAGGWTATNTSCAHDGICIPPLVQSCRDPFTGTARDLTVELGPTTGRFMPFGTGNRVALVWGPQGGAMAPIRIHLAGTDPPACVRAEVTATVDGMMGPATPFPVATACGLSQPVFLILPIDCGGPAEHTLDLAVTIEGVGDAAASFTLTGGDEPCTL